MSSADQPSGPSPEAVAWIRRASLAGVVVIGWLFILFYNNFHVTPPVVFVCLGYLAVVATIYFLFRTGISVVEPDEEEDDDAAWERPVGPQLELEREKRSLLKAIKEVEFDFQMGKLSQHDADEMIRMYRVRAIEVIKELEEAEQPGQASGSVRAQIEREVRARLELEGKARKKGAAAAEKVASQKAQKAKKAAKSGATPIANGKAEAKQADAEAKPADADAAAVDEREDDEAAEAGEAASAADAEASEAAAEASAAAADANGTVTDDAEAGSEAGISGEDNDRPAAKEATP